MTVQLAKVVQDRLSENSQSLFSPEALAALRLCDVFDSVRPQEYVLPLDAMAGFPSHTQSDDRAAIVYRRDLGV
ncbi:hypothetical protein [Bradyrhizobium sp. CCBAU 51765]|uniref:hypothetical protein n=1 Tax=Bradyrhizobium sp. CCBAU 51765 TaxID=1325102 RepID=UPI0018880884|nr:hypothetical protein [Bradyrhizobium sp. CCBAU 51765]QOZ09237.1 hypothetical protein XH96_18150 [Bradyrhizobium sp. CCBAU 51765]